MKNFLSRPSAKSDFFKISSFPFILLSSLYFIRVLYVTSLDFSFSSIVFFVVSFVVFLWFLFKKIPSVSGLFIFLISFFIYFIWVSNVRTIPVSDYLTYYDDAIRFFNEDFFYVWSTSKYPSASLVYFFGLLVLGVSHLSASITAAACWSLQAVVIKELALEAGAGKKFSSFIAIIYAFFPSIIVYSPVVSSEATYLLFSLLSLLFFLKYLKRGVFRYLVFSSLFLVLAFYSRPTAIFFIILFVSGLILLSSNISKAICFFVIPIFLAFFSHSVPTNHYLGFHSINSNHGVGGYVMLFGTNQAKNGMYNQDDMNMVARLKQDGKDEHEIKSVVRAEIYDRITKDFPGFARFALGEKIKNLWSPTGSVLYWSENNPSFTVDDEYASILGRLNVYYYYSLVFFFVMASLYYFSSKSKALDTLDFVYLFCSVYVSLMAVFYLVFEVQARYALSITPFMFLAIVFMVMKWRRNEQE